MNVRRVVGWFVSVILVGVAYVGLTTFEVWRVGRHSGSPTADAIVVMGAAQYDGRPSPQLAARLDHVIELWNAKVAPAVIVTGGQQPGDRFTEAGASAAYLVDHGIPKSSIREEDTSRSTWEAFVNIKAMLATTDHSPIRRIVIVTDPFHSLRSQLIAEENGFVASTSATRTSPVVGGKALEKHLKEGCGVAIGRIIGFRRLWKITG